MQINLKENTIIEKDTIFLVVGRIGGGWVFIENGAIVIHSPTEL